MSTWRNCTPCAECGYLHGNKTHICRSAMFCPPIAAEDAALQDELTFAQEQAARNADEVLRLRAELDAARAEIARLMCVIDQARGDV